MQRPLIDRTQDGTIWLAVTSDLLANGTTWGMRFYYSKDNGSTWTKAAFELSIGTSSNHYAAIFIDADDNLHVLRYNGNIAYGRATPNAGRTDWTNYSEVSNPSAGDDSYHPRGLVAFRMPGSSPTTWKAFGIGSYGNDSHVFFWEWSIANNGTITRVHTTQGGTWLQGGGFGSAAFPSIDFRHTGDGKTVLNETPHLYVAWRRGTGNEVRFRRIAFSGGAWSQGDDRVIASGLDLDAGNLSASAAREAGYGLCWDGLAVLIGGTFRNSANTAQFHLRLWERDAGDTTTTTRVALDNVAVANRSARGSICVDPSTRDVFFVGRFNDGVKQYIGFRRWVRATATLEAVTQLDYSNGFTNTPVPTTRTPLNSRLWTVYHTGSIGATSGLDVRAASFTLNQPPNAPALAPRANFDAADPAELPWSFSDPDAADTQSAFQLQVRRQSDGVVVHDTAKTASTSSAYTLPAATLANDVQYQWRVRTWDSADTGGAYSDWASFRTSAKPTATITDPTAGETISEPQHPVGWSFSDPESEGQSAYRLMVFRLTGGELLVADTGKLTSVTGRTHGIDGLDNATDYRLELIVWDARDVASDTATRLFSTAFTPPGAPTAAVEAHDSFLRVEITNPAPEGEEPDVVANDLYRRAPDGDWARIAVGLAPDAVYDDYAAGHGPSEYRLRAHGDNGVHVDSAPAAGELVLDGAWLHDPADPPGTVTQLRDDTERVEVDTYDVHLHTFAGRAYPVPEWGEHDTGELRVHVDMLSDAAVAELRALAGRRATLCYRDGYGRKRWVVIRALPVADRVVPGGITDLALDRVDHREAV